jgi:chromosome segregation protein
VSRDVESLQSERDSLAGRRTSLEEIVATHAAFDEGVRALLARPGDLPVSGVVADAVETDSEHERAVEAFLGDRLQAVIVPDPAQALRGIRWLQAESAGRGTFLPLASARPRADSGPLHAIAAREPKALGVLSDFYRVSGPDAERIKDALPDAIVVSALEDALELRAREDVPVVTLEGEALRGSMVEGGRGVKGLLAPRREVKEVAARQEQVEALLAARRAERRRAGGGRGRGRQARGLEEQIHAAEKELVAARHELQAADDESRAAFAQGRGARRRARAGRERRTRRAVSLAEIGRGPGGREIERSEGHRLLAECSAA